MNVLFFFMAANAAPSIMRSVQRWAGDDGGVCLRQRCVNHRRLDLVKQSIMDAPLPPRPSQSRAARRGTLRDAARQISCTHYHDAAPSPSGNSGSTTLPLLVLQMRKPAPMGKRHKQIRPAGAHARRAPW
jgi:hypothetical protein